MPRVDIETESAYNVSFVEFVIFGNYSSVMASIATEFCLWAGAFVPACRRVGGDTPCFSACVYRFHGSSLAHSYNVE